MAEPKKGAAAQKAAAEEAEAARQPHEEPAAEVTPPAEAAVEAAAPAETVAEADDNPRVAVERLRGRESTAFLGCDPHVAAGALHDVEPGTELTISQARKRVEKFLNTEVSA